MARQRARHNSAPHRLVLGLQVRVRDVKGLLGWPGNRAALDLEECCG